MARSPARPGLLRSLNDRTVVDLLLTHGPMSRAEIAALSGLSKPTASEALGRLERIGAVRPAGVSSGRPGPSAQNYEVDLTRVRSAAVTVTSRSITVELVDAAGSASAHASRRRDRAFTPDRAVRALATEAAGHWAAPDAVVVSVPGVYDGAEDVVRYADGVPEWTAPGLAASLRGLGARLVTVDNDVNLAAIAERHEGAGQQLQGFALLWLDEGLGLALDADGVLHRGATGIAGEVGYMPVRTDVRDRAGRPVDFQGLVGGAAVRALAKAHGVRGRSTADVMRHGIADDAFLDDLADRIAVGIAAIVAVADPAVVILGGSVGLTGGAALAERVETAVTRASPLRAQVIPSLVTDPARAGARVVAARSARNLLLPPIPDQSPARPELVLSTTPKEST